MVILHIFLKCKAGADRNTEMTFSMEREVKDFLRVIF